MKYVAWYSRSYHTAVIEGSLKEIVAKIYNDWNFYLYRFSEDVQTLEFSNNFNLPEDHEDHEIFSVQIRKIYNEP